jgi:uncharacterized membrane protein YhaH (DUF805 family)
MLDALKKYAIFEGRARRQEYWLFVLLYVILYIGAVVIDVVVGTFDLELGIGLFGAVVSLGLLIPSISVGVRRLHDIDKSGWMYLLAIVPIANIVLLVFLCLDGTQGNNRFGEDPKGRLAPQE